MPAVGRDVPISVSLLVTEGQDGRAGLGGKGLREVALPEREGGGIPLAAARG